MSVLAQIGILVFVIIAAYGLLLQFAKGYFDE